VARPEAKGAVVGDNRFTVPFWPTQRPDVEPMTKRDVVIRPDTEPYQPDVLRVLPDKEHIKAYYNKIARFYDLLAERAERPMREKGLAMLTPEAGECVLEIGCGTGHCLERLARAVGAKGKVYGLDISEEMLRLSQNLLRQKGLLDRVILTCGDAEHLPYPARSLDAIFMSFTLELFDTPKLPVVLLECYRVLRDQGRLVVVSISKESRRETLLHAFEWAHRHFPNLLDCRPIYARRAIEASGFGIHDWSVEHMWLPVEIVKGVKLDNAAITAT